MSLPIDTKPKNQQGITIAGDLNCYGNLYDRGAFPMSAGFPAYTDDTSYELGVTRGECDVLTQHVLTEQVSVLMVENVDHTCVVLDNENAYSKRAGRSRYNSVYDTRRKPHAAD